MLSVVFSASRIASEQGTEFWSNRDAGELLHLSWAARCSASANALLRCGCYVTSTLTSRLQ